MMPAILIVEDRINLANALRAELLLAGYTEVFHVADGQQAVALFQENKHFDAVIMDISMPVLNGYKATQAIRAQGYKGSILGYSSLDSGEDRQRAMDAGMDICFKKSEECPLLLKHLAQYYPV